MIKVDNTYNLVVIGNGLDLALGLETSYDDFYRYVSKWFLDEPCYDKIKNRFKIEDDDIKLFINFIKEFNNFLKKKCAEKGLGNIEQVKDISWSDLESNIIKFFELWKMEKDPQLDENHDLAKGYGIFLAILTYYYTIELYKKQIDKHFSKRDNLKYLQNFANFLNFVGKLNANYSRVVSFNYTNLRRYSGRNSFVNGILIDYKKIEVETIHLNPSAFVFSSNLNTSGEFNPAPHGFQLNDINEATFSRGLHGKPPTNNENEQPQLVKAISDLETAIEKGGVVTPPMRFIPCAFGTTKELDDTLSFLSKNDSHFLFDRGGKYPKGVVESIRLDAVAYSKVHVFFFGYSFGDCDQSFNNLVFDLVIEGKINKFSILYFATDKDKGFANDGFDNLKIKIFEGLQKRSEEAGKKFFKEKLEIEKKFISDKGNLL